MYVLLSEMEVGKDAIRQRWKRDTHARIKEEKCQESKPMYYFCLNKSGNLRKFL